MVSGWSEVGRSRMKSRSVLAYLRNRWRSEVLHQPLASDDRPAARQTPIRRSHSQPAHKSVDETATRWRQSRRRHASPPVRVSDRREVGVQCSIVSWNAMTRRFEIMPGFRSPVDDAEFSSQEISLAATDGSGTTTLGDAADIEYLDDDDEDDDGADFGWFRSPRRALTVHSAPPPDASQSMMALSYAAAAAAEPRVGASTRVAQLRHESADRASTARGLGSYSEPEPVRCCSATGAGMAVPRVDVAALRRQFRRRKAITLADFDVRHRFSRLSDSAAVESVSQRSAVTQQR